MKTNYLLLYLSFLSKKKIFDVVSLLLIHFNFSIKIVFNRSNRIKVNGLKLVNCHNIDCMQNRREKEIKVKAEDYCSSTLCNHSLTMVLTWGYAAVCTIPSPQVKWFNLHATWRWVYMANESSIWVRLFPREFNSPSKSHYFRLSVWESDWKSKQLHSTCFDQIRFYSRGTF